MAKVGVVSLGCPKNLVDSEEILGALAQSGWDIVSDEHEADVILINTCAFIQSAKEESIDTVLEMTRLKTDGRCKSVIVTGCLAQRYGEQLRRELPEVDAIVGIGQAHALPRILDLTLSGRRVMDCAKPPEQWVEPQQRMRATPAWTAYLKLSDGCDNRCSYCAIPDIRGPYRSRPLIHVLADAEKLAREGVKEVNLVGQDITRYGEDIGGSPAGLLRELLRLDGPMWYRLLYCYPTRISDELIELVASEPRIANYLDVPFQHGDDAVLKRMNRRGSSADYIRLVKRLRAACPDIALRTSVIVGFPGETGKEFARLVEFVNEIRFDHVGVFQYSQEEGAPAAALPLQVNDTTKLRRYDKLMAAQQSISLEINRSFIGRDLDVLIERTSDDPAEPAIGRSYRDAPDIDGVVLTYGFAGEPGAIVRAKVIDAGEYDLIAGAIEPN